MLDIKTFNAMEKFLEDVLRIGKWISQCTTNEQIRNIETFYRTIISRQWYPRIDELSRSDALFHLGEMIKLQENQINKK